jgi:aminoglycoside phosphotransferase (APT) family kinase protein
VTPLDPIHDRFRPRPERGNTRAPDRRRHEDLLVPEEHGGVDRGPEPGRVVPSIDISLVRRLLRTQFPQWADLPVAPVEVGGVDNRTFRLGDGMLVRLPSAEAYATQVDKEQRWLPLLAPHVPLPVPVPLARGLPTDGYPFHWSVCRWTVGETARLERIDDLDEFAITLADFLTALQRIDPSNGPPAGRHSFFRGGPLETYDADTRGALDGLNGQIDRGAATAVWETALAATWNGSAVWFHGDVAPDNLLVRDGRLAAVIDFGCSGVGDPACDLTIAWTFFTGRSRDAFRAALALDPATWARGRGWALWKALITLVEHVDMAPAAAARQVIDHVLADHERSVKEQALQQVSLPRCPLDSMFSGSR